MTSDQVEPAAAIEQWPRDATLENPRTWLVSAGRFSAIDAIRRRARFDASQEKIAHRIELQAADAAARDALDVGELEDDRLRLIFTCCHPAKIPPARVAASRCGRSGSSAQSRLPRIRVYHE